MITMPVSAKFVLNELLKNGWQLARVTGSHHILKKNDITIALPVHGSKDLKLGLLKDIEKKSKIKFKK
ncbi:hypothetical protein GCM10010995_26270 [Cysteiniphilum litorale]|uniref:Addiction module toxin, HicA family n=2 Tax=Fastidiosibacteraceae TaxID=2056687 RepID=A0A8J2Z708_9GAMM|nr:hypothetical protein GCM10010995_26270 [Cysteiniphilum litorale]